MIEVPSAALLADEILADRCSFVHIGTNDLTQYTYAADRRDSRMSGYFTCWPHAVGRLIDMVVAAAWSQELPVTHLRRERHRPGHCRAVHPSGRAWSVYGGPQPDADQSPPAGAGSERTAPLPAINTENDSLPASETGCWGDFLRI